MEVCAKCNGTMKECPNLGEISRKKRKKKERKLVHVFKHNLFEK